MCVCVGGGGVSVCVYALRIVSTDKNLRLIILFISSNRIIIKTKLTAQMVQREAALTPNFPKMS